MSAFTTLNKKELSERDICTKFITPVIREVAGWNDLQFLQEFTLGKIFVRGKVQFRQAVRELQMELYE